MLSSIGEWLLYPLLIFLMILMGIISLKTKKSYSSVFPITIFRHGKKYEKSKSLLEEAEKVAAKDRGNYFRYR